MTFYFIMRTITSCTVGVGQLDDVFIRQRSFCKDWHFETDDCESYPTGLDACYCCRQRRDCFCFCYSYPKHCYFCFDASNVL